MFKLTVTLFNFGCNLRIEYGNHPSEKKTYFIWDDKWSRTMLYTHALYLIHMHLFLATKFWHAIKDMQSREHASPACLTVYMEGREELLVTIQRTCLTLYLWYSSVANIYLYMRV
jgi:hypothetical protein